MWVQNIYTSTSVVRVYSFIISWSWCKAPVKGGHGGEDKMEIYKAGNWGRNKVKNSNWKLNHRWMPIKSPIFSPQCIIQHPAECLFTNLPHSNVDDWFARRIRLRKNIFYFSVRQLQSNGSSLTHKPTGEGFKLPYPGEGINSIFHLLTSDL